MVEFVQIEDADSERFKAAIEIYVNSLPAAERQTIDIIKQRVVSKKEKMFIGLVDSKVVMAALIWPFKGTDFVLLDYFAVKKEYRNQGIGSGFIKDISKITKMENKAFVLEVEDPKEGKDIKTREKRIQFYRRNGAKVLKDAPYLLPPLQDDACTQMVLMVISHKDQCWLSGSEVKGLIYRIYWELYARGKKDPLLNTFINRVPVKVYVA